MISSTGLPAFEGPMCPLPLSHSDRIVLGHGSGGRMTHDLIRTLFLTHLGNPYLEAGNDFARLPLSRGNYPEGHLILSTDSHVISPLFFPGGDIGRLAVCGTVNDVSMSGAVPLYLTAAFILEEGVSLETLERVVQSMHQAADEAGVLIVAGDTKVVEKGKGDGLFITTTGVGWLPADRTPLGGEQAHPGDVILLSGSIGDHGIAVLSARGELGFEAEVKSDVAPLNHLIQAVLKAAPHTHVLRDPTRGGLATTLNEIAQQSQVGIRIEEATLPLRPAVQAACELLGLDPLYIANEGKVIAIVPPEEADAALTAMRQHPYGSEAVRIGIVEAQPIGRVIMRTTLGTHRVVETLSGELLPRIC